MIFRLSEDIIFPAPELSNEDGILAFGGDLSPKRLILAYQSGIFPWYSEDEPIIWWSPNPRFVLYPEDLKVSKSMKQIFRKGHFKITYDQAFEQVIRNCSKAPRKGQDGTWIVEEMITAYINLHKLGIAHSAECWENDQLVGGLYGISLGKVFFGESMFAHKSNASKAAFLTLGQKLKELDFELIDSQVYTDHLASLGAIEIDRSQYLNELATAVRKESLIGNWGELLAP